MNINNLDQGMFTEEQIKNDPNAILFDPTGGGGNTPNLPDVPVLMEKITEILEYMCEETVANLRNSNFSDFETHMETKFSSFSMRYFGIFQKLINGEDITPLLSMFISIDKIKSGVLTIEQAEKQLGEELAETYIYPNLTHEQKLKVKKTLKNENFY
jgi:hypothetical protein